MLEHVIFPFSRLCPELTEREHAVFAEALRARAEPGSRHDNYVYRLYWLARATGAKKMVELGATPGTSTLALAFARRRTGGHLFSCDIGPIPERELTDFGVETDGWTRVERTDAAQYGRSWQNGPVDFIYLDASHALDATTKEIDAWMPHLREGGFFVFHDVESCRPTVFRAVADAMLRRGCCFEYHHFPDTHGHGVLQWFANWRFHPFATDPDDGVVGLTKLLADAVALLRAPR